MTSLHSTKRTLGEYIRIALRRPALIIGFSATLLNTPPVHAVELPQICTACSVGNSKPVTWVTTGVATATRTSDTLTINQSTESVTLNWASFNISADGKVIFSQPSNSSIALNRIFQQSPSQILGSIRTQLNSDASQPGGQIYLINPNGFIFGSGSSVNAAGILVSTMSVSDKVRDNGLLSAIQNNAPALDSSLDVMGNVLKDENGNAVANPVNGTIIVSKGASMNASRSNGRILLAASSVTNAGELTADDGQIILAAGDKVYVAAANANNDPLRGLYVEVGVNGTNSGTVLNDVSGVLSARRGDISVVGMAINQEGRISATTSVSANGSVHLLARKMDDAGTKGTNAQQTSYWQPSSADSGTITLGSNSSINIGIAKEDSDTTAVDAQLQDRSSVRIAGKQIIMQGGANITAHGGDLTMHASVNPNAPLEGVAQIDDTARLRINSGATIDLSGNTATRSVVDNIVEVELRGTELADSPDQRNGALRGKTVTVDARVGTAIADVSGAIASIGKTVAQRTSEGGKATFVSTGDIVAAKDAVVDVSGGHTTFTGAMVSTSQLITADGKIVDIANAKADVTYVGVISPSKSVKHDRWGVIESLGQQTGAHYEAGYMQGSSAGAVTFNAPTMIMNATLSGHAVNGAYQRDPLAAYYAFGGLLKIGENNSVGKDYRAPSITLANAPSNVSVSDDFSVSGIPLTLSTDYLRNGGFTRTEINSNETVTIAPDAALDLADGSSFVVRAAQVNVDSGISNPAGTIDINSLQTATHVEGGGISVADNVQFNVNGRWINYTEASNTQLPVTTLFQNGGTISLNTTNVGGQLRIGNNADFSADGGAWLQSNGVMTGGKGGKVALLSNGQDSSFYLGDNVGLSGYGVNGASGGTVSLAAGRIEITERNTWADAQIYDPAMSNSLWYFTITPKLFRNYGFSNFNITASGGVPASQGNALQIASNTHIDVLSDTLLLSTQAGLHHSGEDVHLFSTAITLPDYQRSIPSVVNLNVVPSVNVISTETAGAIDIQQGAMVAADPGSKISLVNQNGGIHILGSLTTHAGNISARILAPANLEQVPYDSQLGIVVGDHASLDASGIFVPRPNDATLLQGTLLDGGSVSLIADMGAITLQNGSLLDVSGTSTRLDVPGATSSAPYNRQQVGSNAGNINLSAAESVFIDGNLQAKAGKGDSGSASGGSLSIALTRNNYSTRNDITLGYPSSLREVHLANVAISAPQNGVAAISPEQINAAGFDGVSLGAADLVKMDAGTSLTLRQRLQLDAPALEIDGDSVSLSAGYVSIGNSSLAQTTMPAISGTGKLAIAADNLDLTGSFSLRGIDQLDVISKGDIRLIGVSLNDGQRGELFAANDMNLEAARIYATTATQFAINNNGYDVTIKQGNASPGTPLSAASKLIVNASSVHQNGTLLAPFGSIEINAKEISLGAGSVTSVSAADTVIPFGTTDSNGKTWLYNNGSTFTSVLSLPERSVLLKGDDDVAVAKTATIDLSGGGDLYAYEWTKGTGGTNDAFDFKLDPVTGNATASLTNPGLFAILPALGTQLAPVDVANLAVTRTQGLKAGDTVYLSGTGSLATGFYTLLPASYSLLPGSYLVNAVTGFNNIQPSTSAKLADGTPVVAGYRSFGSTGIGGSSYSGFAVYPGSWGRSLAQYQDTYASKYFDTADHRTVDAGQLGLITGNTLAANGNILSAPATGGRAASIDISASNLQIVGALGQGTAGVVQLQDSVLNNWHAGSLLLGGNRENDGKTINVAANEVTVASGAHLSADEVIMVATDKVGAQSGGSVQSTSSTAKSLGKPVEILLKGDGADQAAMVAISSIAPMDITRESVTSNALGKIDLAQGSVIATEGALVIDAPNGGVLESSISGANANWTIASSHLVLSDTAVAGQLTVNSSIFGSMQAAKSITLSSSGSIDFDHYVNVAISLGSNLTSLNNITLRASALNNLSQQDVALYADNINVQGIAAAPASWAAISGNGILTATAKSFNVSGQSTTINGFDNVQLLATQLQVTDKGGLLVDGDMNVTAARITAAGVSNGALIASGNVKLDSSAVSASLPALEIGGGLTIKGSTITNNANIVMPSGVVSLDADRLLTLGSAAVVDVSGMPVYAAGVRADSSGGVIHLSSGGNLSAFSGSRLNVNGSNETSAGTIDVRAGGALDLQSMLSATTINAPGGSISIDAQSINDFSRLNGVIQQAGFSQQQSVHTGNGDLILANGKQITARDVQWVTDSGRVLVDGVINSPSTESRSSIRLYGADGVSVRGQLHADGKLDNGRGGVIELGVSTDLINHSAASIDVANASITAAGHEQGRLRLRAPVVNGNDVNISALPTGLSQLDQVTVEAVATLVTPSTVNWTTVKNLASNTFNSLSANAVLQSKFGGSNVLLSSGVELISAGDINLGAVDLYSWNIDSHHSPAAITVRAGGNINVNGVISDGFTSTGTGTRKYLSVSNAPSATLRLVAGSNFNSVDPLAVDLSKSGDIVLGSNAIVRTGTGDLSLAAARDVIFNGTGSSSASVYTGGNNTPDQPQILIGNTGASASFLINGGQLSIAAGHDVKGVALTESATAWQPRTTCSSSLACDSSQIYWGTDLRQFLWNAGTLGGGDVDVSAGNNINTLSVAAADTGIVNSERSAIAYYGSGALDLHAGNNFSSGMLYAGRSAYIVADNAIAASQWGSSTSPLGMFIAMGNAQVSLNARTGVALSSIVNPTILDFPITSSRKVYFYTYGAAGVTATSSSGDVVTQQNTQGFTPFFGDGVSDLRRFILPSTLVLSAISGNVATSNEKSVLFPTDNGNLSIFAAKNINNLYLVMSDAADSDTSLPLNPAFTFATRSIDASISNVGRSSSARHVSDLVPVTVTAGNDIINSRLEVAKATHINAGNDIVALLLYSQNLTASDISEVIAGRDIVSNVPGGIISIGGPGQLDIVANRNIDLGVSFGVESTGRLNNANIPDKDGAAINMLAGMNAGWSAASFIDRIVVKSESSSEALIAYVEGISGMTDMSLTDAAAAFKLLTDELQRPFILKAFFNELVQSGSEANAGSGKGYSRGYAAIDALFPDSRGDSNPYKGDISMLFSRVYTLSGGGINMLVPGGKVDVGVAARPRSTTLNKEAGQLGIVAEQTGDINIFTHDDVSVNSSRIFTLGGGDISIWSTLGNIDAGKGAKSSLSVPPPATTIDAQGNVTLVLTGAVAGSGIRTIQTNPDTKPGNVTLIAPAGIVDAGDAGIGASGNIIVAAKQVVGAENINFGGQASGVPAATSGAGVAFAGASQTGGSGDKSADKSAEENARGNKEDKAPIAQAALSWLEVFVTGLGEENCKQDDVECLKRQK